MKTIILTLAISLFSALAFARAPLSSFGATHTKYDFLPHTFKIVNWNIYKGGKAGMARDFAILSVGADVALLQEAIDTPDLISEISNANPELAWNMVRAFQNGDHFTGVATGSRIKALRIEGHHSVVREPIVNTPKTMMVTEYAISNSPQTLLILNIHAINFVLNSQYKKQVRQLIEIVKNHMGPLLIAGDFNTWNSGRKTYLDQSLRSIGVEQLLLKNQQTLDHAYVRDLSASVAEVITGVRSSDHKPFILHLQARAKSFDLTAN